jgi:hypothetical protein
VGASYIVVQDLLFDVGVFSQTNTYFLHRTFVSWDPTNEQPQSRNDPWHWLAGNTLRVRKIHDGDKVVPDGQYETQPVEPSEMQGTFQYHQSWQTEENKPGIVHLALPRNCFPNISSLGGHVPFHVKFDRGRIGLDWFAIHGYPTNFTFELIQCEEEEFQRKATDFVQKVRLLQKNTEKERLAAESFGVGDNAGEKKPKDAADGWLKNISLVIGIIAGIVALIPQTSSLFGPFDYAAETLLVICVLGIIVFGVSLVRSNPTRRTGWALVVAAPIVALLLWYSVLRLPPQKRKQVEKEVALGDAELNVLHNPAKAREHYGNALLLAPRLGSIRAKMQDAQERRSKGD